MLQSQSNENAQSIDYHMNTCGSLKRRAILKSLASCFRKTYALSVSFKMKHLRKKRFTVLKRKLTQILP